MHGSPIVSPIFLLGSVRSGTTLLRLLLDHHSQVAFHHDFEFAVDLVSDDGRFPDMAAYRAFLETDRVFLDSDLAVDVGLDYPGLMNSFLRQKRDRGDKRLVGATVHRHFERLPAIWPDARYIHLVRDGRDVSRSIVEQGWAGNPYMAAETWREAELAWDNLRMKIPAERRIEVVYEDLVRKPEADLCRLCEFLGVSYERTMLDYAKNSTYDPPSPRSIGKWRTMSTADVCWVEARVGAMLTERGYELSGHPLPTITPGVDKRLRRESRRLQALFRVKRYGAALVLGDLAARRLGLTILRKRLTPRLHAIERKHLM